MSLALSPPRSVRADAGTDADAVGDAFGAAYLAVGSGADGVEEAQPRRHLCGILQFEGAFGVLGPLHSARAILRIEQTAHQKASPRGCRNRRLPATGEAPARGPRRSGQVRLGETLLGEATALDGSC